jgi:putative lipoic acid-binding regulatory protein
MEKRAIDYPAELTFKSVFRDQGHVLAEIEAVLSRAGIDGSILCRRSGRGTFVSYTVRAVFSSDEELQSACAEISAISGFMMMF